eukprot:5822498-Pleurochrysis_carterae.AAC.1
MRMGNLSGSPLSTERSPWHASTATRLVQATMLRCRSELLALHALYGVLGCFPVGIRVLPTDALAPCVPFGCVVGRACALRSSGDHSTSLARLRLCVDLCLLRRTPPWSDAPKTGYSPSAAAVESTCDSWMSRLESLWACAVSLCDTVSEQGGSAFCHRLATHPAWELEHVMTPQVRGVWRFGSTAWVMVTISLRRVCEYIRFGPFRVSV